jgi:predicted phosphodiesterase
LEWTVVLILHLSDIHFRKAEITTAQDPNHHLRHELVRDVVRQCERLGPPDAIILSGDVAFAGEPDEFVFATDWLRELCAACGGTMDSIFVCPGNHDVTRSKADSTLVQLIHMGIKTAGDADLEHYITTQLLDVDVARLLYESLDNYNAFALQFFCDLLPPERTRATRDLPLNDGSTLRLWGLNTAFVSSSKDKEGDIFVDSASLQLTREDGVVNLVAVHHHLSWLRQRRAFEDHLNDVAPIQIFGHVHTNRIDMNRDYMRLTASATHPDRQETGWEPGYNLIEITVDQTPEARRLHVRAHVRVWQTAPGGFQAKMDKGADVFEHFIPLEAWRPTPLPTVAVDVARTEDSGGLSNDAATPPEGGRAMNTLRDIGLRFYRLSFSKKSEIAGRLELLEDEDMGQPDFERFRRVFLRAHERGRLDELADAIRAAEGK